MDKKHEIIPRTIIKSPKSPQLNILRPPLFKIPELPEDERAKSADSTSPKKCKTRLLDVSSPSKNSGSKSSPERQSVKVSPEEEEEKDMTKKDVKVLSRQIKELRKRLEYLGNEQLEVLNELESERIRSSELQQKLKIQEEHQQHIQYSQMILLNDKSKTQEMMLQSIKNDMLRLTQDFRDKSEELESKKKKLQKANKDQKELNRQIQELQKEISEKDETIEMINKEKDYMKELLKQIDEQEKLKQENEQLKLEREQINQEKEEMLKIMQSIKRQNLMPQFLEKTGQEPLKLDDTVNSSGKSLKEDDHRGDQFNATFAVDTQQVPVNNTHQMHFMTQMIQNSAPESGYYNPVPSRTFSKIHQPSLKKRNYQINLQEPVPNMDRSLIEMPQCRAQYSRTYQRKNLPDMLHNKYDFN